MGDVEPGLDLRRLHAGAREDIRLTQEELSSAGAQGFLSARSVSETLRTSSPQRFTAIPAPVSSLNARMMRRRSRSAPQTTKRPSSPAVPLRTPLACADASGEPVFFTV